MPSISKVTLAPVLSQKIFQNDSFVDKLTGTLTRKKKPGHENPEVTEEDEAQEIEIEGRESIDACLVPALAKNLTLDEGEMKRYLTKESSEDPKFRELISLLIYWINDELADLRIVVRNLQEDLYDGQVLQMLMEKLAGIRIEVPEVTQSEEGQKRKLDLVVQTVNRIDIVAIIQILIAMVLHFRAPIRLPEYVSVKMLVASKHQGHARSEFITEQLTTTQGELGLKGERDAFDTLFDYGPDKLAHVKTSLLAFCNKHLNKINLEVHRYANNLFLVALSLIENNLQTPTLLDLKAILIIAYKHFYSQRK
ncbi:unnamed protein product [Haemonchus placei]|uniref:Calponin-homology (CH) domain-containing protein n=1 Tax=Haemonchus placei TaxID=6290 RepID=A0A3P7X070_HAEPC|nr:unnamed protein product [Haemonchus placei]